MACQVHLIVDPLEASIPPLQATRLWAFSHRTRSKFCSRSLGAPCPHSALGQAGVAVSWQTPRKVSGGCMFTLKETDLEAVLSEQGSFWLVVLRAQN